MSATTTRKRKAGKLSEGQLLAGDMFKKGIPTSQWTEHDAKTFFGMRKTVKSVFRTGREDTTPVEWYLDEKNTLQKRDVV